MLDIECQDLHTFLVHMDNQHIGSLFLELAYKPGNLRLEFLALLRKMQALGLLHHRLELYLLIPLLLVVEVWDVVSVQHLSMMMDHKAL
jgi:hypothetical protein